MSATDEPGTDEDLNLAGLHSALQLERERHRAARADAERHWQIAAARDEELVSMTEMAGTLGMVIDALVGDRAVTLRILETLRRLEADGMSSPTAIECAVALERSDD